MTGSSPLNSSTTAATAPIERSPFATPALLEGENEAAYSELLLQLSSVVGPADTIEEIWTRDIVDLTWEVWRWRRLKAALLAANAQRGLRRILRRLIDDEATADRLAERWATGHPPAVKRVNRVLAKAGLSMDAVMAETLVVRLDSIERIDGLVAAAERRRNAVLHEIERHRASFAASLRRATTRVEDAAFKVVAPKPAPPLPGEA